jgi:hypothetical protein
MVRVHIPTLYLFAAIHLLSCWHQQINEFLTPTPQPYSKCRIYNRSMYGISVFCILLILFIASIIVVFMDVPEIVSEIIIPVCFILLGAFLIMSIKPASWALSFNDSGCFDHYHHGVMSRTSTTAYVLLCIGSTLLIQTSLLHTLNTILIGGVGFSILSFCMYSIFKIN